MVFLGGQKIFRKNHASHDGQICNMLDIYRDPRFLGVGNHLEQLLEDSGPSEGQEQGGGAVGGQGRLQGVKL